MCTVTYMISEQGMQVF